MGEKVIKDISPESTHEIPKIRVSIYSCGGSLSKLLKEL